MFNGGMHATTPSPMTVPNPLRRTQRAHISRFFTFFKLPIYPVGLLRILSRSNPCCWFQLPKIPVKLLHHVRTHQKIIENPKPALNFRMKPGSHTGTTHPGPSNPKRIQSWTAWAHPLAPPVLSFRLQLCRRPVNPTIPNCWQIYRCQSSRLVLFS